MLKCMYTGVKYKIRAYFLYQKKINSDLTFSNLALYCLATQLGPLADRYRNGSQYIPYQYISFLLQFIYIFTNIINLFVN